MGKKITALFQSVTARTAGFQTVDFQTVGVAGLILIIVLMFIGTASGSTGGGIKTSTASIVVLHAWDRLCYRKRKVPIFPTKLVSGAWTLTALSLTFVALMVLVLNFSEEGIAFIDLLFESVSAFSTVGLSTRITKRLSNLGKITLMTGMFVGKIGPLSLVYLIFPGREPELEPCRSPRIGLG